MKQFEYAAIAVGQVFLIAPLTIEVCPVASAVAVVIAVACTIRGRLWEYEDEGDEQNGSK